MGLETGCATQEQEKTRTKRRRGPILSGIETGWVAPETTSTSPRATSALQPGPSRRTGVALTSPETSVA
jgi:hypothetical protein